MTTQRGNGIAVLRGEHGRGWARGAADDTVPRCGEPFVAAPDHQHRCVVPRGVTHDIGSAPGDDFETDIHKCQCGFTWVVN